MPLTSLRMPHQKGYAMNTDESPADPSAPANPDQQSAPAKPPGAAPQPRWLFRPVPFMSDLDEAEALSVQEKDPFYVVAFMLQGWLGGLLQTATTQYAENKSPKNRSLQTGEAWRDFVEIFGSTAAKGYPFILRCLFRFSMTDDSSGNCLRTSLTPLMIEHLATGDYVGPRTQHLSKENPEAFSELARRTVIRWCDWLDADVHLRTHRHYHSAPATFHPDPETRYLAALGNAERNMACLSGRAQLSWLYDFVAAAAKYKNSPKWKIVGQAMGDSSDRLWLYPELDTLVIRLWPLVKTYNWTYRDLLNVIQPALARLPSSPPPPGLKANNRRQPKWTYPCEREQDLSTYCTNVLGLRKTGKGASATDGHPAGYNIALTYCPSLDPAAPSAA